MAVNEEGVLTTAGKKLVLIWIMFGQGISVFYHDLYYAKL